MSTETEALEQLFAAMNRNDMTALTKDLIQSVHIEPEGFPTAGAYRGIAKVQQHITPGRGTWAEGSREPDKLLANGNKVVEDGVIATPSVAVIRDLERSECQRLVEDCMLLGCNRPKPVEYYRRLQLRAPRRQLLHRRPRRG